MFGIVVGAKQVLGTWNRYNGWWMQTCRLACSRIQYWWQFCVGRIQIQQEQCGNYPTSYPTSYKIYSRVDFCCKYQWIFCDWGCDIGLRIGLRWFCGCRRTRRGRPPARSRTGAPRPSSPLPLRSSPAGASVLRTRLFHLLLLFCFVFHVDVMNKWYYWYYVGSMTSAKVWSFFRHDQKLCV